MDSMSYSDIADMVKRHEGYRDRIYKCTAGVLTVGWGHAFQEGDEVPAPIIERLFYNDISNAYAAYNSLGLNLDTVRKAVVIDMIFNLGLAGFKRFRNTIAAIRAGDWNRAADGILASKYAKQVGNRAKELAEMMRTGEYHGMDGNS